MDAKALGEAVVAVALTPVLSIAMALIVLAAIIFLAVKVGRFEAEKRTGPEQEQ